MEEAKLNPNSDQYLYPDLNDPNFNIKIANKREFSNSKYDGTIENVEAKAKELSQSDYELLPQQAFVRNFMSFQTPYNSLLLFHGLGSGKTCSAIGVCEEMRDYLKQMGIPKRIIIVASPNVQDNFKLQLFDERKLKEVDGIWTTKGCLGNKLLKEINPTGMKGLTKEKVIELVKNIIKASYYFVGYTQFSNDIVRSQGTNPSKDVKDRNLENEYSDRLIVIDEVHNIRISDDNENKEVAKNLMYLVSVVSNMRLLLLSATPMFNSYTEIVWLLNLMNMNDRRGIIGISDIFDNKTGELTPEGTKLLIRKANGYVSYVRGENPYTFPFRVYPNKFAPKNNTIQSKDYPLYNLNGNSLKGQDGEPDKKINKLDLFVVQIGSVQEMGYRYIMNNLLSREERVITTKTGQQRVNKGFKDLKSFGYTDLMLPIQALNIIYPHDDLKEIEAIDYSTRLPEKEELRDDIAPNKGDVGDVGLVGDVEEIESSLIAGPVLTKETNKELEGIESLESIESIEGLEPLEPLKPVVEKKEKEKKTRKVRIQLEPQIKPKKEKFKTRKVKPTEGEHIIEGDTLSQEQTLKNELGTELGTKSDINVEKDKDTVNLAEEMLGGGRGRPKKIRTDVVVDPLTQSLINPNQEPSFNEGYINPKLLTGTEGLKSIMNYEDSRTPSVKGSFEYKPGKTHIFEPDKIGEYSSKIANVCKYIYGSTNSKSPSEAPRISDGIILIYSSYIDAGLIPMALALEEMGLTRYNGKSLFKTPPKTALSKENKLRSSKYIMITGDPRLSPNNDADIKAITNDNNINGDKIKVVLISQAGSEGLDFKAIRQIHILDPWYNVNRLEQIIGRGVRNNSHKDLPFEKRNVQIFLYGTKLTNKEEESADLYVYRISEVKAIKIGKVTRLLKQVSVDCVINHDQSLLTAERMKTKNPDVKQLLSNHEPLDHFEVGDLPNSATCDYDDDCEYQCIQGIEDLSDEKKPEDKKVKDSKSNLNTYNEKFMLVNSDKIVQKIKRLFSDKVDGRFFYKKKTLMYLIKRKKSYPTDQIYAALTLLINDNAEYITDKYGRTGHLINIGEYYLFQPSELNYPHISVFDRSKPLDYKHDRIKFEMKIGIENTETNAGKIVLGNMFKKYNIARTTYSAGKGTDDWYEHCGVLIRKMADDESNTIIDKDTTKKRLKELLSCVLEHIVDTLTIQERIDLMNMFLETSNLENDNEVKQNKALKQFITNVNTYLQKKVIKSKPKSKSQKSIITGMVIFDGPSSRYKELVSDKEKDKDNGNLNVFVLKDGKWVPGEAEDKRDLESSIIDEYDIPDELNNNVGFIGFDKNQQDMVFKIKDTVNKRSTGFQCNQAGREKKHQKEKGIIYILNELEAHKLKRVEGIGEEEPVGPRFSNESTDSVTELCIRIEMTLRIYEKEKLDDKTWFLDTSKAIFNEFEKREKPVKK
jgi:superfamily II DNA or RNA helicase